MCGDRGRVGLEAEQARADFVMQLERGETPLVVLRGNQARVQLTFFGAQRVERLRQRIEAPRDRAKLPSIRTGKTHTIVARLKIAQTCRELRQRLEDAAEQDIEQHNGCNVEPC